MLEPIYFNDEKDIGSFIASINAKELFKKLSSQLILDVKGDTYLLMDILKISEGEKSQELKFSDKNGNKHSAKQLQNTPNELLSLLVYNKTLAALITELVDKKDMREAFLCPILKSPLIYVLTDHLGMSYEFSALWNKTNHPLTNRPLNRNSLIANKAVMQFLAIYYRQCNKKANDLNAEVLATIKVENDHFPYMRFFKNSVNPSASIAEELNRDLLLTRRRFVSASRYYNCYSRALFPVAIASTMFMVLYMITKTIPEIADIKNSGINLKTSSRARSLQFQNNVLFLCILLTAVLLAIGYNYALPQFKRDEERLRIKTNKCETDIEFLSQHSFLNVLRDNYLKCKQLEYESVVAQESSANQPKGHG